MNNIAKIAFGIGIVALGLFPSRAPGATPKPLTEIKGCTLVPTEWADGDSFLVKTPEGKEFTVRLYGADCLEWHVTDSRKRNTANR